MTNIPPPDPLEYSYRPSVLGASWSFRLTPDAIAWDTGRRSGFVVFHSITRVRLSYRPLMLQPYRYRAEVWSQRGPKLELVSTSWKSMVEQMRHDAEYAAFIAQLHHRILRSGARAHFETGTVPFIYWLGALVFIAASLGLAAMMVRATMARAWLAVALIGAFLGMFLWHTGNFFRRNKPGTYHPEELPADLLPPPT